MQSQGPEKVRSWKLSRELQGLQESFCREGILHQRGELHHELGPEIIGESQSLPGSLERGSEGGLEASLSRSRSFSTGCEGFGYPEGLCNAQPTAAETQDFGSPSSAFNLQVTDSVGSTLIPDPLGGEWAWEDFFSESAFADSTPSESYGRFEEL